MENAFFVWQNVPGDHFDVPYPTRLWQAGEYIRDDRRMVVPTDAPPGTYELRVGLFDPFSETRLPVTLEHDRQPVDDDVEEAADEQGQCEDAPGQQPGRRREDVDGIGDQMTAPSLKIGRYIATTMPPTSTPRMTMIIGSSRLDSASTAASTSAS